MRVDGPNRTTAPGGTPAARRSSGSSFSLGEAETAPAAKQTAAPRTLAGIETLLALQGVEDPTERRRRAVGRGRTALDALDALKLGLLAGELTESTLARLKTAASGLKDASGDPALDGVLAEIELRVEVELAKLDGRDAG